MSAEGPIVCLSAVLAATSVTYRVRDAHTGAPVAGAQVTVHLVDGGRVDCESVGDTRSSPEGPTGVTDAGGMVAIDVASLYPPTGELIERCNCPPRSPSCAVCLQIERERAARRVRLPSVRVEHPRYLPLEVVAPTHPLQLIPKDAPAASTDAVQAALQRSKHAFGGVPRAAYPKPAELCFKEGVWHYRFFWESWLPAVTGTVDVAGGVHLDEKLQGAYAIAYPVGEESVRLREVVLGKNWLCAPGTQPFDPECRVAGRALAGHQWSESGKKTRGFELSGPADERCAREGCSQVECVFYDCRPQP